MTNIDDLQALLGRAAVDINGDKIGKVGQVYLDDRTGNPQWVTIHTGLFGTKESFAPLQGSRVDGDNLVLAVPTDLVKSAPSVDADGHLEDAENEALFVHYVGVHGGVDTDDRRAVGRDTSGPTTDDAMTRSEERLRVGTEQYVSGRARLRKYVVTENVTTTVPLRHEEVRIEREPITDANRAAALAGGELTAEEHEVILHAERPVVTKETVPVERIRMTTETVTEKQSVTDDVRKEKIEQVDLDTTAGTGKTGTGKNRR